MDILTMTPATVNHVTFEALDGRVILDAARELDRQYCADAPVAHELAEIVAKHEQDEIAGYRPKAFDTLTSNERAAFIAHAKIGLRMNRPAWRALQRARMNAAALAALEDLGSQWIPKDRIETLALYLTARIAAAGRYALDEQTDKPTPREFAAAIQMVQRRGDQ